MGWETGGVGRNSRKKEDGRMKGMKEDKRGG